MQFADIKNDIAFRKIFGDEQKTAPCWFEATLPISRGPLFLVLARLCYPASKLRTAWNH